MYMYMHTKSNFDIVGHFRKIRSWKWVCDGFLFPQESFETCR